MTTSTPDRPTAPTRACGCAPDCCAMPDQHDVVPAPPPPSADQIRDFVREHYNAIAIRAGSTTTNERCGCGPSCCSNDNHNDAPRAPANHHANPGYSAAETASIPSGANLGLGCGNPLALASIRPGETILDLGSGAGFDCLLAARQLAGTGRVIGVDMTPAMIAKARANARRSSHTNIEFRLGEIESLPVADATVDLILSNCVINLSPEKPRVFHEAFRVLKPGGRLAIADIVATRELPATLRADLAALGACVAGATPVHALHSALANAGFTSIEISPQESSRTFIDEWTPGKSAGQFVVSATISALKPPHCPPPLTAPPMSAPVSALR